MKFSIKKRWKILISIISLIIIVLLLSWPKAPEVPNAVNNLDDFETYLESLVEYGTPPGISLVVVKDNNIVYAIGFSTIMQIQPERNIGFILFANNTNCAGCRSIQLASGLDW